MVGAQLGWFSLSGNNSPLGDSKCGPMGVGELLLSNDASAEVNFLKLLAYARKRNVAYLVDGYLLAPPLLTPAPLVLSQSIESQGRNKPLLDYDAVSRAHWTNGHSSVYFFSNNLAEESYRGALKVHNTGARGNAIAACLYSIKGGKMAETRTMLKVDDGGMIALELPPRTLLEVKM